MRIFLEENFLFGSLLSNHPSYSDYKHLSTIYKEPFHNFLIDLSSSNPQNTFCGTNKKSLNLADKNNNSIQNNIVNKYNIYHYHLFLETNKCLKFPCNNSINCSFKKFISNQDNIGKKSSGVIHYLSNQHSISIFLFSNEHVQGKFPSLEPFSKRFTNKHQIDMNIFIPFSYFFKEYKVVYPQIIHTTQLFNNYVYVYNSISHFFHETIDLNCFIIDIIHSHNTTNTSLKDLVNEFISKYV